MDPELLALYQDTDTAIDNHKDKYIVDMLEQMRLYEQNFAQRNFSGAVACLNKLQHLQDQRIVSDVHFLSNDVLRGQLSVLQQLVDLEWQRQQIMQQCHDQLVLEQLQSRIGGLRHAEQLAVLLDEGSYGGIESMGGMLRYVETVQRAFQSASIFKAELARALGDAGLLRRLDRFLGRAAVLPVESAQLRDGLCRFIVENEVEIGAESGGFGQLDAETLRAAVAQRRERRLEREAEEHVGALMRRGAGLAGVPPDTAVRFLAGQLRSLRREVLHFLFGGGDARAVAQHLCVAIAAYKDGGSAVAELLPPGHVLRPLAAIPLYRCAAHDNCHYCAVYLSILDGAVSVADGCPQLAAELAVRRRDAGNRLRDAFKAAFAAIGGGVAVDALPHIYRRAQAVRTFALAGADVVYGEVLSSGLDVLTLRAMKGGYSAAEVQELRRQAAELERQLSDVPADIIDGLLDTCTVYIKQQGSVLTYRRVLQDAGMEVCMPQVGLRLLISHLEGS